MLNRRQLGSGAEPCLSFQAEASPELVKAFAGTAGASAMVTAVKGLPTQQQLLLCAATSLLGADGPPPGISTPSASFGQRRSSLGFSSPLTVRKQVTPAP